MASTGEARVASFEMARTWFRLAEEQEDESANIDNIEVYAATGVDYISSGSVIHHAVSLDLSLKMKPM